MSGSESAAESISQDQDQVETNLEDDTEALKQINGNTKPQYDDGFMVVVPRKKKTKLDTDESPEPRRVKGARQHQQTNTQIKLQNQFTPLDKEQAGSSTPRHKVEYILLL